MKENVKALGQITEEMVQAWPAQYEEREGNYYCKNCGAGIMQTTCYVSIHAKEFEPTCAGPGRVLHINYPYCPNCDGGIDHATACVHVPILKTTEVILGDVTLLLNPGRKKVL